MQSYHDNLILQFDDQATGNAASGQLVTVFDAGLATKPAIFDTLGSPIANPLTTDIKGNFSFTIADGIYDIVGRAGTPDETRRDQVQIAVPDAAIIPRLNPVTVLAMIADVSIQVGDKLNTIDYFSTQRGGGAPYLVKTSAQATTDGDVIDGFGNHALGTGDVAILQPATAGTINAVQWGIVNDATFNNASILIAVRDFMLSEPETRWILEFNGGQVNYDDSSWLVNVKYLTIKGGGAKLFNTKIDTGGVSAQDRRPTYIQRIFEGGLIDKDATIFTDGVKINDAQSGAGAVVVSTAAEAAQITVGEWALVYGFDQQNWAGYLPNCRFFDWLKVSDVNIITGVIEFEAAQLLANDYRNTWIDKVNPDVGLTVGAARIISAVRTVAQGFPHEVVMPVDIKLEDVTFSSAEFNSWGLGSIFLSMKDVEVETQTLFFMGLGGVLHEYDNVKLTSPPGNISLFTGSIELDKLCNTVSVKNMDVSSIFGGSGCNNAIFENVSQSRGGVNDCAAKNQVYLDCDMNQTRANAVADALFAPQGRTVRSIAYSSSTFKLSPDIEYIDFRPSYFVIPDAAWQNAGAGFIITLLDVANNGPIIEKLDVGGILLFDGDSGTIKAIKPSGANLEIRMQGTRKTSQTNGDIRLVNSAPPQLTNCNMVYDVDGSPLIRPLTATAINYLNEGGKSQTITWRSGEMNTTTPAIFRHPFIIEQFTITVRTAYTGTSSVLGLFIEDLDGNETRISIDLKATGKRIIDNFNNSTPEVGDSFGTMVGADLQGGIQPFIFGDAGFGLPSDWETGNNRADYQVEMKVRYMG